MLPGLIAGHYDWQQCHIDLGRLCGRAGAELVQAQVAAVDAEARTIALDNGRTINWDLLSLNTGSTPDLASVPGAREHVVPIHPVSGFLGAWDALLRSMQDGSRGPVRITVVGGGAAGVEVVLAIHHRLQLKGLGQTTISLVTNEMLPTHPRRVRQVVAHALEKARIDLFEGRQTVEVKPGTLRFASGPAVETTFTVWTTGAAAPPWLAHSRLATDARGFLTVDRSLQSVSHPWVLAAGDIASLASHPVPKAGVYAVRQGPVLAENLRRLLRGRDAYRVQAAAALSFAALPRRAARCGVLGSLGRGGGMGLEAEGPHRPRLHTALRIHGKHTTRIEARSIPPPRTH
jgi:selenide,water dikinase